MRANKGIWIKDLLIHVDINYFNQYEHILDIDIHYLEQGSRSGE